MCESSQGVYGHHPGLYVVATPLGNLGDLAPRAKSLLETASAVAAEDTRTVKKLVTGGSTARFVSLTEHNVHQRIPGLLEAASSSVVALVSDAGTPAIADPGSRLVAAAHQDGIPVYSVPGPSALAAALAASGFETSGTLFLGFLPRKRGERISMLQHAAGCARVAVFFESPGRLGGALRHVAEAVGDVEASVSREISKVHEENIRGYVLELAERFEGTRGECTVVVQLPERETGEGDADRAFAILAAMKRAGARRSTAASEVSRLEGLPRGRLYDAWEAL